MDKNWFSLSGIGSSEKRNMHAGSFETCWKKNDKLYASVVDISKIWIKKTTQNGHTHTL